MIKMKWETTEQKANTACEIGPCIAFWRVLAKHNEGRTSAYALLPGNSTLGGIHFKEVTVTGENVWNTYTTFFLVI